MIKRLRPPELKAYLESSPVQPLLLDVREVWEFEHCSIAGSLLIPMGQIHQQLEVLDPDQEIVLICHHGVRSMHVAYFLERAGFAQLVNLEGGVDAWAREIDLTMELY